MMILPGAHTMSLYIALFQYKVMWPMMWESVIILNVSAKPISSYHTSLCAKVLRALNSVTAYIDMVFSNGKHFLQYYYTGPLALSNTSVSLYE